MLLADSVVLLGLRAMLADYMAFMFLAILCSFGFFLAFYILGKGIIPVSQLAWMMVKVFLGNSYSESTSVTRPPFLQSLMLIHFSRLRDCSHLASSTGSRSYACFRYFLKYTTGHYTHIHLVKHIQQCDNERRR